MEIVAREGLVLLGCGKMGSALLAGWLKAGIAPGAFWVIEPNPTDWLKATGVHLNEGVPKAPGVALLACQPCRRWGMGRHCSFPLPRAPR